MSKIKKVLAMLLALAMVLGMSVTTFAANEKTTATITIQGLIEGSDVHYVQIVEPDTSSKIGWKFINDTYAQAFIDAFDNVGTSDEALKALIGMAETTANANAEAGKNHSSSELATALQELTQYAKTPVTGNTIPDVKAGLYLVTAAKVDYTYIPMLAYVNDNGSGDLADATLTAKVSTNIIQKAVAEDGQSVSKGDKVDYTVKTQYPFYPTSVEAKDATFVVTDTLETATFEDDMKLSIKVGNTELVKDNDYSVTRSNENKTLTINFNYAHAYAGDDVEIKYTATVGDVSTSTPMKNDATLITNTSGSKARVIVPAVKFVLTKTGDEGALLPGAEFTLYVKDENSKETITLNDNTVVKVTEVKKVNTDDNGKAVFEGLDAQKEYYVKETVAPRGYTLSDEIHKLVPGQITKSADVVTTETTSTGLEIKVTTTTYTATDFDGEGYKFVDTKLSKLPSTGGIGTTIFTIGGCLIMIAAAGLFFASRRKSAK